MIQVSTLSYQTVLDKIQTMVEDRLAGHGRPIQGILDPETPLDSVGVDSIDLIVVLTHFEQEYNLDFENLDVDSEQYPSLSALAIWICNQLAGLESS